MSNVEVGELEGDEAVVVYGVDGLGNRMPERVFNDWEEAEEWRDEQPNALAYGMTTAPIGKDD